MRGNRCGTLEVNSILHILLLHLRSREIRVSDLKNIYGIFITRLSAISHPLKIEEQSNTRVFWFNPHSAPIF